ncbi:putative small metal-binding protein [Rhizobium leguminosarum]
MVRRAVEHLKDAHGETTIRENMVDNIKARIRDEATAA